MIEEQKKAIEKDSAHLREELDSALLPFGHPSVPGPFAWLLKHDGPGGRARASFVRETGGIARMTTLIKPARRREKYILALHAGDVSVGSFEFNKYLGYPGVDFEETLVRAMAELLGTPIVEGPVKLEQKIVSYAMTDEALERLSQAQKQLLRMGPKGVRAVHGKIRELAAALGVPASRLPKATTWTGFISSGMVFSA